MSGQTAQADALPETIDDLFVLFGVGDVPADFVVVVDTSGSMSDGANPPYPSVLTAFDALAQSIPDGDTLSVISFDASPTLLFQGEVDPSTREQAREALPSVAEGSATDIGAALDASLRRLERADSSKVQLLIFLTDGAHQPADGSAFPTTEGPSWDELRARADETKATSDVLVIGVALGDQGAGGIELLRQVFGNPEINNLPPDQLPAFFEESVRRSQVARLKSLLDAELESGTIQISSASDEELQSSMTVEVEMQSTFSKLPVEVDISSVSAIDDNGDAVEVELVSPSTFAMNPGASSTVEVLLTPDLASTSFQVPPVTEADDFEITVDASYQVLPGELLGGVTTVSTQGVITGTHDVDASRTYGWSIARLLLLLAVAVLTSLFLLWVYRRFLRLPDLVGVFVVDRPADDDREVIELKGKTQRISAKDVPGAGAAKIEVFTRRGKPNRVYAKVETPSFFEVEDRRRERLVPEETEIRFHRYRLGGGRIQYRPSSPNDD